MGTFIVYIIVAVVCGFISLSINQSKGYEGGFWWGFLLSILGIIIVAVRPFNQNKSNSN